MVPRTGVFDHTGFVKGESLMSSPVLKHRGSKHRGTPHTTECLSPFPVPPRNATTQTVGKVRIKMHHYKSYGVPDVGCPSEQWKAHPSAIHASRPQLSRPAGRSMEACLVGLQVRIAVGELQRRAGSESMNIGLTPFVGPSPLCGAA